MNQRIFTIPNLISAVRILLVPVFVVFFFTTRLENHMFYAIAVLLLSGASDIADGIIARRCNMVSDLGKLLDPVADKLTQAAVVFCLVIGHPIIVPMFVVFLVKELLTAFAAMYLLHNGAQPISARWWGKLSTVVIYVTTMYLIVSGIFHCTWQWLAYLLVYSSIVFMLISMFGYLSIFLKPIAKKK